jgi:hypothetical protein
MGPFQCQQRGDYHEIWVTSWTASSIVPQLQLHSIIPNINENNNNLIKLSYLSLLFTVSDLQVMKQHLNFLFQHPLIAGMNVLWCYAVMLLCCYAGMLLCCYTDMLIC